MTILVTGATGNIGRPLLTRLTDAGAAVRALSRDPARAALPGPTVAGDPSRPHTLHGVFDGVTSVFLTRALGADFASRAADHAAAFTA